MPGTGHLTLTGQLGDVMKESAMAALTYIRSVAPALGVPDTFFKRHDIHIHVPAGAVPKDGPSAGQAIAVALASMVLGRPIDPEVAMTGEITLTGQVLAVGGIKEKVLAARRAGITKVFLPDRNEADFDEIKEKELVEGLTVVYVDHVSATLSQALGVEGLPVAEPVGDHGGETERAPAVKDVQGAPKKPKTRRKPPAAKKEE